MTEKIISTTIYDKTSILMETHACKTTEDILKHVNKTLVSHPDKKLSFVIDNNIIHDRPKFY